MIVPPTEAEKAEDRADVESAMQSTCTIYRDGIPTTDPSGFMVPGFGAIHSDLPCRIGGSATAQTSRTSGPGDDEVVVPTRTAHFPALTTDLADGDLLEVTSGDCVGEWFRLVETSPKDDATARRVSIVGETRPEGI